MKQCGFHYRRLSLCLCFIFAFPLVVLMGCNFLPGGLSETKTPDGSALFTQQTQVAIIVAKQLTAMPPTATVIPSPTPTNTPTMTPTPIVGVFSNPYPIGVEVTLPDIPEKYSKKGVKNLGEMSCKLLEVKTGEDAKQLAKKNKNWYSSFTEPIQGQEYLAVRVHLKRLWYEDNTAVDTIYPYFSLTLRYGENGDDTWSTDPTTKVAEGYPPIEGEGWTFFLIKSGTKPLLYFQPNLISSERIGIRTEGAYFTLY